jgi:acylphosphatase
MSDIVARRVIIHGLVQGVGFRAWTQHVAQSRGLQGWVRNLPDGRVEALFAGTAEAVEGMIGACHRGPRHAAVEAVDVQDAEPVMPDGSAPGGFAILRDG